MSIEILDKKNNWGSITNVWILPQPKFDGVNTFVYWIVSKRCGSYGLAQKSELGRQGKVKIQGNEWGAKTTFLHCNYINK